MFDSQNIIMEIDLNKIVFLSKEKEDENWDFRTILKGNDIKELDNYL